MERKQCKIFKGFALILFIIQLFSTCISPISLAQETLTYMIGWTGNLTGTKPELGMGSPVEIKCEVWNQQTQGEGQAPGISAQLGYRHESEAEYTWLEASYNSEAGNNDVYSAIFTPDQLGKWTYIMRVSGDGGQNWTETSGGAKSFTAVDPSTIIEGEETIEWVGHIIQAKNTLVIGQPLVEKINSQVFVKGLTEGPGAAEGIIAQLGYKNGDDDYTWIDATYLKDDYGTNDVYEASFNPNKIGKWTYVMRYSGNKGKNWTETEEKSFMVIDEEEAKLPYHTTLTWTEDPKTSQTITWKMRASTTSQAITMAQVQYALAEEQAHFEEKSISVLAQHERFEAGLNTDLDPSLEKDIQLFSATLTNLTPGASYVYRVGDGTHWSDLETFSTEKENADSFQFFVFADSQSGRQEDPDYVIWGETARAALKKNPDAKFFLNVGDLVEKESYLHWSNWFDDSKGIIEKIPMMPVTGNHEYYISYGINGVADYFTKQLKLPQNGPSRIKQAYSFDYGDVHIAVLNSQQEEVRSSMGDILQEQKIWLEEDLKNTDKKWKIVMFHKALYYSRPSRAKQAEEIRAAFQPIIDKYHVDVVFNAHDHSLTRTYPLHNHQFVDSPSKGTVYYITGRTGNKTYSDVSQQIWDVYFNNSDEQPNYLVVDVNNDILTIKALGVDGTILDTYSINKTQDTPKVEKLPAVPVSWAGNLSEVSGKQPLGAKVEITAETYAKGSTDFVGQGVNITAQLGYKHENDSEYTWTNASYLEDSGKNNDRFKGNFTPEQPGTWSYNMRFSGDQGATWLETGSKSLIVEAVTKNTKAKITAIELFDGLTGKTILEQPKGFVRVQATIQNLSEETLENAVVIMQLKQDHTVKTMASPIMDLKKGENKVYAGFNLPTQGNVEIEVFIWSSFDEEREVYGDKMLKSFIIK